MQTYRVLHPRRYLILVVKDYIRNGVRVTTAMRTIALCEQVGFLLHARHYRWVWLLSLWQLRRKEAGLPVVEEEDALVFSRREIH